MISAMRARVSSRTNGDSLMTRDTVFFETFASRAMSLIVCLRSVPVTAESGSRAVARDGVAFVAFAGPFFAAFLGMGKLGR